MQAKIFGRYMDPTIGFKYAILMQTFVERLALFVIPLYIYQLSGSRQLLGITLVLEWLPTIILLPIAGRIVDRFGTKTSLVASSISRILVALLLGVFALFIESIALIFIFAIITSALNIVSYISFEKYVATTVPTNQVSSHYSFFSLSQQLNLIVAPVVGATVMIQFSIGSFYVIYGLLFLFVLICFSISMKSEPHLPNENDGINSSMKKIVPRLLANSKLIRIALLMLLTNSVLAVLLTTIPDLVIGHWGQSEKYVALIFTASALLSLLFHNLYSLKQTAKYMDRIGRFSALLIPALILVSLIDSKMVFVACSILVISLTLPFSVWSRTLRNELLPKQDFAVSASSIMVVSLIGYPIGGAIVSFFGHVDYRWMFLLWGATVLIIASILLRKLPVSAN